MLSKIITVLLLLWLKLKVLPVLLKLYLTQPTISKILQQLEEAFQVQLLVKPDHGRKDKLN